MFIRTKDSVKITDNNYQHFSFLNTSRKGNTILKFELANNDVRFYADELNIRMVPKDKVYLVQQKDIKIVTTEDGLSLIFQDFEEEPVKFLSPDEDTDEIKLIDFFDLIPEQTDILCFDNETEGYYFSRIAYTSILIKVVDISPEETDVQTTKNNMVYLNELKTLSRYIIGSKPKEGVVLNGIMVI
jgi:hypothetical protein